MKLIFNRLSRERLKIILPLFLPLLFLLIILIEWVRPLNVDETVYIKVEKGDTLNSIIPDLYKSGIYPARFAFKIYYRVFPGKINAGDYFIREDVSIIKLARMFSEGHEMGIKVTFPEGTSFRRMSEILLENGVFDTGDEMMPLYRDSVFLEKMKVSADTLEGYCYPDTYYFTSGAAPEDIIEEMHSQLLKKIRDNGLEKELRASEYTLHEILTLASIIEGEAAADSERPLISQVFRSRLEKEMPLESCATVLFALGRHRKKLYFEDLEIKSPYNTYKRYGLPPGPINNPGIASIEAALRPADTEYLYFVSKKDGTHHFSRTYAEHLAAKKEYLQ